VVAVSTQRSDLVEAAHVLSRLGLVTAFGHVSARAGTSMLITPAADLATVTESTVVDVPLGASTLPTAAPAEAWAHLALYRARPDAGSIARAQPAGAVAASATTTSLAPLHGQAAWLGESIPVYDSAHLLRSAELAERAARSLPTGEALLLRGNGALTLGATPGVAVARMVVPDIRTTLGFAGFIGDDEAAARTTVNSVFSSTTAAGPAAGPVWTCRSPTRRRGRASRRGAG